MVHTASRALSSRVSVGMGVNVMRHVDGYSLVAICAVSNATSHLYTRLDQVCVAQGKIQQAMIPVLTDNRAANLPSIRAACVRLSRKLSCTECCGLSPTDPTTP